MNKTIPIKVLICAILAIEEIMLSLKIIYAIKITTFIVLVEIILSLHNLLVVKITGGRRADIIY